MGREAWSVQHRERQPCPMPGRLNVCGGGGSPLGKPQLCCVSTAENDVHFSLIINFAILFLKMLFSIDIELCRMRRGQYQLVTGKGLLKHIG